MIFTDGGFIVPLVCSLMGVLGVVCIAVLFVWHHRQKNWHRKRLKALYYSDHKTNNETTDNLRRYRNPLFENTTKPTETSSNQGTVGSVHISRSGPSPKNVTSQELQDYDLDKFEKSPTRRTPGVMALGVTSGRGSDSPAALMNGDFNDYREHSQPFKSAMKKNINVQLDNQHGQRSRVYASEREVVV